MMENRGSNRGSRSHLREEQGDLLADAVSGMFGGEEPEDEEELEAAGEEAEGGAQAPGESHREEDLESPAGPKTEADTGAIEQPQPVEEAETSVREPEDLTLEMEPEPATPPIPDSLWEQKMAWAKERARDGRLEEAEELYRELIDEAPSSVRALNNLGVLLDELGEHDEAVTHLQMAQKLDPSNQEVLGNLGAALGASGRYMEAEEQLRSAFRLDPSNLAIRANLGILLFRRGLYSRAEVELGNVCAADPDHGLAFYYRGEALNRLGRVDEAIAALERVIQLMPENPRAHYTLGVLFDKQNLPQKAAIMYRKARELGRR
jgi:Flp pilus assembly protein TadD